MPETRKFGFADLLLLLVVLALAAGARAGYLVTAADNARSSGPLSVQDELKPEEIKTLVRHLKDDNWFGGPAPFAEGEEHTAHLSPGYPYFLAMLAKVVDDEGQRDAIVRWIQCGLGTLACGLYFLFARRAFRSLTVATLTGLLCAANPFWVVNTAAINDGVLISFLVALAVNLGSRAGQGAGAFASLLFGLALAAVAMVRAALLPFAFVSVGWFLLRTRSLRGGWLAALLAFLGFAIGLSPWTVRNWQTFEEPVPVVDSAHYHLWIGNNPQATGGPEETEAMRKKAGEMELSKTTKQTERYNKMGALWLEEVRDYSLQTLQRRVWAGLYFVFGERWFTQQQLADYKSFEDQPAWLANSHQGALLGTLLGMLLLGFLGWRWSYGWRRDAVPAAIATIWIPLPYLLSHAEALSGPRLPLDGVLLCYAAFALACLVPGVGNHLFKGAKPDEPQTEEYR
jgi:4-amino-4-deoxy-L-arabinose transferase-like glycosyltransferase